MLSVEEFDDAFSKRLEGGGRRSAGKMPPSGRSKSISRASRRKTLDPSTLPGSRGQPVPQVSEVGCGCKTWNKMGLGIDFGTSSTSTSESTARKSQTSTPGDKTPPGSATSQICPKSANLFPKSVSGMFRRVKSAPPPASSSPKFEEQWSSFREQHQQEMNEMKQMYSALQSMCHEIKTITGLQQPPPASSSPRTVKALFTGEPESLESPPPLNQKLVRPTKEPASEKKAPPERCQLVTPRRAQSVPRARSTSAPGGTLHRDLTASVNLFFRSPWNDVTATLFEEIVQVQKMFLRSFCQSLTKHREADAGPDSDVMSSLVARLLPHTSFAKPWHLKYAVEAWVNRLVLGDFGTVSFGLEEPVVSAWDEYQKLALLSPSDAINPTSGLYHASFHMFCNRKFQAIHDELQWWEEWPAPLVEEFLEAMKHVWRAHKLAFSFDPPAAIFCVKTATAFDPKYMETVLEVSSQFDSSTFSSKVGFMVTPGFLVHGLIIKSQVYLMPKVGRLICSPSK